MLRSFRTVAAAAAALLVLPLSSQAQEVVRLGNLKFAHYGAVSYIKEIAPQCGIKVEEKIFAKGPDIMQAIIAGELDVGASASEAAIAGRANGMPIVVVAGFASGGARLVARPEAGVKTVADLKGRKVGVTRGGIQEILLFTLLKENGLTVSDQPGKDVQVIYLGFPDLNQALLSKNLEVIMQSEPHSSQAINNKFGVEVLKPYNTAIGVPIRTMVMTETFYKDRRPVAERFMQCFVRSTKAFIDDPKLASKYVRETMFKGQVTEADFDAAIGNSPYGYDITPEHIQVTADMMFVTGVGRMSKAPVAKDFVKTDMLEAAKKVVGVK